MRLPGFTAEASFSATSVTNNSRLLTSPDSSQEIIPALPIGGYGCLALAKLCASGLKGACSALKTCRGGDGYPECTVAGGGCAVWSCFPQQNGNSICYCEASGPPTVTCFYGTVGW